MSAITKNQSPKAAAKLVQSLIGQMVKTLAGTERFLLSDSADAAVARGKVFQLAGYLEDAADSWVRAPTRSVAPPKSNATSWPLTPSPVAHLTAPAPEVTSEAGTA